MLVECLHKIRELDVKSAGFKDVAKNALRSAAEKLNPVSLFVRNLFRKTA